MPLSTVVSTPNTHPPQIEEAVKKELQAAAVAVGGGGAAAAAAAEEEPEWERYNKVRWVVLQIRGRGSAAGIAARSAAGRAAPTPALRLA